MQGSTKILLPIGAMAILGLGALVVLNPEPDAPYPVDTEIEIDHPIEPGDPDYPENPANSIVAAGPARPAHRDVELPPLDPASGSGRISGHIAVTTRIIERISAYTIVIQEDVNMNGREETDPKPFFKHVTFPARLFRSPYFDIENIPFCKHPYKVSVIAEGVNGSSQHTYINAKTPAGSKGDVQLSLTPGAYFAIRLRDQRQNYRPHLSVRMIPVGASLVKRATQFGETDSRGAVLFEDVVTGDYEIFVGPVTAPLAPPETVTVYHAMPVFDPNGRPKTQGAVLTVPDGHHVTIEVWSRHGYAVENAKLKAWQLAVKRYYEFKGTTNRAGIFVFENVPYGEYQISIQSATNGLKDLKFKVEKDKNPPTVKITMPR